jgi:hypothetical protein
LFGLTGSSGTGSGAGWVTGTIGGADDVLDGRGGGTEVLVLTVS